MRSFKKQNLKKNFPQTGPARMFSRACTTLALDVPVAIYEVLVYSVDL